jgi:putative PIN family toxin of toxin-antitoxin system
MAQRLVLDTNVWLDWLVFNDPGIWSLRSAVEQGAATILTDEACLDELTRVLSYPLRRQPLVPAAQAVCIATCRAHARVVEPGPAASRLPACADPDDQKFLELADRANAHCLLSRDRALLALGRKCAAKFHIMTPERFFALNGLESPN